MFKSYKGMISYNVSPNPNFIREDSLCMEHTDYLWINNVE